VLVKERIEKSRKKACMIDGWYIMYNNMHFTDCVKIANAFNSIKFRLHVILNLCETKKHDANSVHTLLLLSDG